MKLTDLIKKQREAIKEQSGIKKPLNEVDFTKVQVPAQVRRFMGRFIDSLKGANLNKLKQAAILYQVIEALNIDTNQLTMYIQKVKAELRKGGDLD